MDSLKFCEKLISELHFKKYKEFTWPFLKPVDVVAWGLHDYFERIPHPMDLGTIRKKLKKGHYATSQQFAADIRLICSNCFEYNEPDNVVYRLGKRLLELFERKWIACPEDLSPGTVPVVPSNEGGSIVELYEGDRDQDAAVSHAYVEQDHADDNQDVVVSKGNVEHDHGDENQGSCNSSVTELSLPDDEDEDLNQLIREMKCQFEEHLESAYHIHKHIKQLEDVRKQRRVARDTGSEVPAIPPALWNNAVLTSVPTTPRLQSVVKKELPDEDQHVELSDRSTKELPDVDDNVERMSYNEIRSLSLAINKMPANSLKSIVEIIQSREQLLEYDAEEYEIDYEMLRPSTLVALKLFVSNCN